MLPRTVLLDLDGPILNVRQRYFCAHLRAATGLPGRRPTDAEIFWAAKRQRMSLDEILGVPPNHPCLDQYRSAWHAVIESEDLLTLDTLQDGAVEALARLSVLPERVLVTMRTSECGVRATIERLGLLRYFTHVEIVPHSIGTKLHAFRTWGTVEAPEDTTVIGDSEVDIDPACELGFRVIALSNGVRTADFLLARNIPVVPHLEAAVDLLLGEA